MKLARRQKASGDIDLTSFSDLAFLLIVFFVLTTTFVRPQGASLSMPSKTTDPEDASEEEIPTIHLYPDRVIFENRPTTLEALRQRLFEMQLHEQEDDKRLVILETNPDVAFEHYFRVVTAVSKAGGILAIVEQDEGGGGAGPGRGGR